MTERLTTIHVREEEAGLRLDVFVARRGLFTRSQVEKLAKQGRLAVEGRPARPGQRLEAGQRVQVPLPERAEEGPRPERIAAIPVLFQDECIAVISKPPGLAVHPGAGRTRGTLVNALLAQLPALGGGLPDRPGIVHRLDRDTSGVMVVAKTPRAYEALSQQVREHTMDRRYLALVWGVIPESRLLIDIPIGRRLEDATRMAAVSRPEPGRTTRAASTDVRVQQRFASMTLVEAKLITGRTHQIRVHLAHLGHPVVGDPVYGRRTAKRREAELDAETLALVRALPGQALHAHSLTFRHPATGQLVSFSAPPYPEMAKLLVHMQASVV